MRAAGNDEMARVHWDVTERIRIIRRLDFTRPDRIEATYVEHAKILRAVMQRKADQAQLLLRSHIEQSKAEVRKITLHTLQTARERAAEVAASARSPAQAGAEPIGVPWPVSAIAARRHLRGRHATARTAPPRRRGS